MLDEKKIAEKWDDGYRNGINWPDAWETHAEPGGPYIYGTGHNSNKALHEQSKAENAAWREGWKKGHYVKISTGRKNPLP
jgi:hypothetical protein